MIITIEVVNFKNHNDNKNWKLSKLEVQSYFKVQRDALLIKDDKIGNHVLIFVHLSKAIDV